MCGDIDIDNEEEEDDSEGVRQELLNAVSEVVDLFLACQEKIQSGGHGRSYGKK